jgi:hypothetical protein
MIPISAYLKESNFDPCLMDILLLSDQKCHFRNEPLNIQKNVFNKLILDFCSGSKSIRKRPQGKNRLPLLVIHRVGHSPSWSVEIGHMWVGHAEFGHSRVGLSVGTPILDIL